MRRLVLVCLILSIAISGHSYAEPVAGSAPVVETLTLELQHLDSRQALVVLRSILGLKSAETAGEQGIKVAESAEDVANVRAVIELVDVEPEEKPAVRTLQIKADQSMVARIMLQSSMVKDAMMAIREQVGAKHIAAVLDPPLVILRGSSEEIEAAKQVLKSME